MGNKVTIKTSVRAQIIGEVKCYKLLQFINTTIFCDLHTRILKL